MSEPEAPSPLELGPGPLGALGLTCGAWLLLGFGILLVAPAAGAAAGVAFGTVLAYGGLGTLAARRVPPPVELRLGLRGMPPRMLLLVLLMAPLVILTSELDNWLSLWVGADEEVLAAQREAVQALGALGLLEWMLLAVGLKPVVEEFFFRGLLLQGVVAHRGRAHGLLLVSALYALVQATVGPGDAYQMATRALSAFVEGLALGGLRLATGSLLAPILLHALLAGAGLLAVAQAGSLEIPGFNTAGEHTPSAWLLPSLVSVGLGLAWLRRELAGQSPLPPAPPGDAGSER